MSFLYLLPSVITTEFDPYFSYDPDDNDDDYDDGIDSYFYYDWCEMIPSVQIHCMYLEMHVEMKFLHSALKRTEIN